MATTSTKVPSIYKVPSKADPELKQFANSVKEALEVRLGRRGDPRDRAVTLRELIDSGMAQELTDNPFNPNAGVQAIDFEPQTVTDYTIPPTPTGFSASASYTSFILSWDNPQMSNLAYTEVWRSTTSSLNEAVKVDTTSAHVWSEEVGYNKTYYYWVRHVSTSDIAGQFSSSGTGTTSIDIGAVMANLSETLANLPGYSTLTALIDSSAGTAATVIKSASAPTQRASGDALTGNDIWYDTDDGQVYTRNAANNAWVAARDATLVNIVGSTSYTGSSLTAALASAQSDVITLTNANSSRVSEINSLQATTSTQAGTFIQNSQPTANNTGDIWIDSNDDNKMYRWSGSAWVVARDTANDGKTTVFTQNSQPTANNEGDIWFDTNSSPANKQYRWDGSSWVEVRDVTTDARVDSEATARANADSANATSINNLSATVTTKARTFVQNGVPTATAVGDLWIDSNDDNKLYRAASATADQITSGEWVAVRDTANDGKTTVFTQNGQPTANNTGDLWFDTNDGNKQYRWDGSSWVVVRDVVTQASVTTVQNAVANGTSAQAGYGVAVNANGAVAGMYLMADSSGTLNNNTSTSNIIFEAGQVTIRNPHGNNIVPFTVLTSTDGAGNPAGVYIDQAYIKNASITAAQIGSLSADLVNAVAIDADSIDAGTLDADRIGATSITGGKIAADTLSIDGVAIGGSIGTINGTTVASASIYEYDEIYLSAWNTTGRRHVADTTQSTGSDSGESGSIPAITADSSILGNSPIMTFTFTTFDWGSGTRKHLFLFAGNIKGSAAGSGYRTEGALAFVCKATTSATDYTSTSGYVFSTGKTMGGDTAVIGSQVLSEQADLNPNTQYYVWLFGGVDDISNEGLYDSSITVLGLNK